MGYVDELTVIRQVPEVMAKFDEARAVLQEKGGLDFDPTDDFSLLQFLIGNINEILGRDRDEYPYQDTEYSEVVDLLAYPLSAKVLCNPGVAKQALDNEINGDEDKFDVLCGLANGTRGNIELVISMHSIREAEQVDKFSAVREEFECIEKATGEELSFDLDSDEELEAHLLATMKFIFASNEEIPSDSLYGFLEYRHSARVLCNPAAMESLLGELAGSDREQAIYSIADDQHGGQVINEVRRVAKLLDNEPSPRGRLADIRSLCATGKGLEGSSGPPRD